MSELNQNTEHNESSNQTNRPEKIERQTGIWR